MLPRCFLLAKSARKGLTIAGKGVNSEHSSTHQGATDAPYWRCHLRRLHCTALNTLATCCAAAVQRQGSKGQRLGDCSRSQLTAHAVLYATPTAASKRCNLQKVAGITTERFRRLPGQGSCGEPTPVMICRQARTTRLGFMSCACALQSLQEEKDYSFFSERKNKKAMDLFGTRENFSILT